MSKYTISVKNFAISVDEQRRLLTQAFTSAGMEQTELTEFLGVVTAKGVACTEDQKAALEGMELNVELVRGMRPSMTG